ncbi:MAG TPA: cytochrome c [Steroidobacteraceae bacterium]|nr:cytochrome c [Steroidobacteraceae bacterium]
MKLTDPTRTVSPRNWRGKSPCFIAIFAFSAIAPSWADEQATIGWTRHTVQVTSTTPRGYAEYQNSCSVCHGPMPERPGTRALAAKYKGSVPAMLEERRDLSPELIRAVVRNGITVMPHFRKTELSDTQLDAIVAYLTRARP